MNPFRTRGPFLRCFVKVDEGASESCFAVAAARGSLVALTVCALSVSIPARPASAKTLPMFPDDQPNAQSTSNHPPQWNNSGYGSEDERRVRVGDSVDVELGVTDADHDPITIEATGLPPGARLEAHHENPGAASLKWRPTKDDVGTHDVVVTASDGKSTITRTVRISVEDDWQSYFMPGLQFSYYVPKAREAYGTFMGASAEILFASWIHRNENRGPSHGRVYLDMDVLGSSKSEVKSAFDFSFGFDLSIERNPTRHYLLPFFGMKTGGFIQKDLEKGGFWHVTPLLGMYLWADKNVFVSAGVGYMLPISGGSFDDFRGLRGTVGANFSLW